MEHGSVLLQPAFILQHRKYRETSLIFDCFTRDFGRVSILAKGVQRKNSPLAGLLQPFTALSLSYLGRSELKTLSHAELSARYSLPGIKGCCGFYANELLCLLLHRDDPYPELYQRYQYYLKSLQQTDSIQTILRYFELDLLDFMGYGLQLPAFGAAKDADWMEPRYRFCPDTGILYGMEGVISAQTLQTLQDREELNARAQIEAKRFLRQALDYYLQGKTVKSRAVLAQMLKYL